PARENFFRFLSRTGVRTLYMYDKCNVVTSGVTCPLDILILVHSHSEVLYTSEEITMDNEKAIFTTRKGDLVEIESYSVAAETMTSVHRLKEDFEARGEYLSIQGVMLHVIGKGIAATRHYWDAADKNKDRRDFAEQAAGLFNSDGTIKDAEALAKLAIEKGL